MSKYNNDIYNMYEKEAIKNEKLSLKYEKVRWEVEELRYNNKKLTNELNNFTSIKDKELDNKVTQITEKYLEEINNLKEELNSTYKEIERLKQIISNKDSIVSKKDYQIDKLNNKVNKNSSNSGITTSKEIIHTNIRTNKYNHRKTSNLKSGGQFNHAGITLTKKTLEDKIKSNNIEVRKIKHIIKDDKNKQPIIKYKIGIETKIYVEEHIFEKSNNTNEKLPTSFYSDVTYSNDIKMLIVLLGNYYNLPYNKIKEFIGDITNGIIDISEGTIDNIYEEFNNKTDGTLNNITNNILNGSYQHTDETTTKENGKDTYYRGYANEKNVIYKYHHKKGDKPIKEDGIITNYFGTIISDHETGVFKYGIHNQDCVIHLGRHCIEKEQNIDNISWPIDLYRLLLKFEKNRNIVSKFGKTKFSSQEIKVMENEYDYILSYAEEQNKNILSSYWKEKTNALLRRCIKYKASSLFFIHDFTIPFDNNFMEKALRMIKCKTIDLGLDVFKCEVCGKEKFVFHTCKSRMCSSCCNKYNKERQASIYSKLFKFNHRHVVWTIPEELRKYFREDRKRLNIIFKASQIVIESWFNDKYKKNKITPAYISILHTYGRSLIWNSHIHMILLEGGLNKDGFVPVSFFSYAAFRKRFMKVLLDLLDEEINSKEFKILKWKLYRNLKEGFYVFSTSSKFKNIDSLIKYVTRYVSRPVMAESRILDYDKNTVTFWYQRHEDDKIVIEKINVYEFISRLIIHIPNDNQKYIRYYGCYNESSKCLTKKNKREI